MRNISIREKEKEQIEIELKDVHTGLESLLH